MRPGITPGGSFAAADGFMFVITMHEADFRSLCDALELPEVRDDPRFATSDLRYEHITELMAKLTERFKRYTTAELARRFRAAGLMHARVNDYLEFLRDPHVEAMGIVTWIEQPGVGRVPIPRAPGLVPPTRHLRSISIARRSWPRSAWPRESVTRKTRAQSNTASRTR